MKSALFESLKLDMPAMAEVLRSKGRGGDKVLAHITPREARKLKKEGGSGTINPDTGLPEFDDGSFGGDYYTSTGGYQGATAPSYTPTPSPSSASTEYTGGGYSPEGYTPTYTAGRPEVSASPSGGGGYNFGIASPTGFGTENVAPPIDFSSIGAQQGPGITGASPVSRAGVQLPGVQTPTVQDTFGAATTPTAPGEEPGITDRLAKALGISKDQLGRLGLGLGQGVMGAMQARKAGKEAKAAKAEQQALAAPYQQKGQEMIRAAQAGELTPVNQQALQAAQAKLAQSAETRGGVGAAQMATQIESFRQQLLQGQYDMGLQVSGIGDQIALGAIKSGMEADRYVNQLTSNYFTNIARTVYGGVPGGTEKTITVNV